MALIELRKISKAYGKVSALRELDLTVPEGCLYGLLGQFRESRECSLHRRWQGEKLHYLVSKA